MKSISALLHCAEEIYTGLPGKLSKLSCKSIRVDNGLITDIGDLHPFYGEDVIDMKDCIIYPAWVNTHHHLSESLLKGVTAGINDTLTPWRTNVPYKYRHFFNEERFRIAVRIGLIELALSGCGTVADHNYIYSKNMSFDSSSIIFEEAGNLGLRMVLCRGGQIKYNSYKKSTLKVHRPDILRPYFDDVNRLINLFNDPSDVPMQRIAVAPSTPMYAMSIPEMREIATFARCNKLRLHSHLSETVIYQDLTQHIHGMEPVTLAEKTNWLGKDVWFAHLVKLESREIRLLGESNTGIAHCSQSNGRLGSGIAPVRMLEDSGVTISIGVDGSGSNESANMLSELHCAWLTARARGGLSSFPHYAGGKGECGTLDVTIEDVIRWGTRGGAQVLGLDKVGTLEVGMAADIAAYSLDDPRHFGFHDRSIAPIACGGATVRLLLVNGCKVVQNGAIPSIDLECLGKQAAVAVRELKALGNSE